MQKGVNLTQLIPPANKIKTSLHYETCLIRYREVANILSQHGVNLFPQVTKLLSEVESHSVSALSETLQYIYYFLGKSQDSAQYKCAQFLIKAMENSKWFKEEQIRQIYYGILHNVDVSKYANPDYPAELMSVIREGLEQSIDLMPYIPEKITSETSSELRQQLRMLTGMMPLEEISASNNIMNVEQEKTT